MSEYETAIVALAAKLSLIVDLKAPPPSREILELVAVKLNLRLAPPPSDDEWDHD